ncbi:MAG: hypothetical protein VX759_09450, partial [SAR324 cluster bacterium]|nr:hypothetical protein [SAR324 cluster bacterium]
DETKLFSFSRDWNEITPLRCILENHHNQRGGLHAKIQQDLLNILMFFYKHVGNSPLIPTYLV